MTRPALNSAPICCRRGRIKNRKAEVRRQEWLAGWVQAAVSLLLQEHLHEGQGSLAYLSCAVYFPRLPFCDVDIIVAVVVALPHMLEETHWNG